MKRRGLVLGIIALAYISMSSSALDNLDMQSPDESINMRFKFKYKGVVNTGKEVMPLVGQLSKDGLTLYLSSQNFKEEKQLYVMKRPKMGENFEQPIRLRGAINSNKYDIIMPTVSGDERTMVFVNSIDGTQRGNDLYITTKDGQSANNLFSTTRMTEDGPFANVRPLDEINDPALSDSYPWLSNDGLRLYFTKQKGSQITFYQTSRESLGDKFSKPQKLDFKLPEISNNMSCFLSIDELEIFVLSGDKIYQSTRESLDNRFSAAKEIATSGSNGYMSGITMTPDNSELFVFNSVGFRNTQILHFVNTEAGKHDKQKVTVSEDDLIEIRF